MGTVPVQNDCLMSTHAAFVIPLKGIGLGVHAYDLKVDRDFLAGFPTSPVADAAVDLHLIVDKQNREMVVDANFSGTVATQCDRCLADIHLPIADRSQLIVKFSPEAEEQQDEGEIVYIHPDTSEFNLAPFVYEAVMLAIPMIRTFDCREGEPPYPCDEDLLERIEASYESSEEAPLPQNEDPDRSSPWDVLKDLNKN